MVSKRDPKAAVLESHVPQLLQAVTPDQFKVHGRFESRDAIEAWCELAGSDDTWDNYSVGESITHTLGMTVEEADHMASTRLFQNNAKAHFVSMHMATSNVGRRLVYGGHLMSVCRALAYDGLETSLGMVAINGGTHVAPTVAGDTLYARSVVQERIKLQGRSDIGALRIRTFDLRNLAPSVKLDLRAAASTESPERQHVVLELDYVLAVPRRPTSGKSA